MGAGAAADADHDTCLGSPKMKDSEKVLVTKPLESTFAVEGSRICLHCSFNTSDRQYLYVAWKIGVYTIERSSSDFEVIGRGGDFILYVRNVQLDMSGKVVCELRQALPNRKYTSLAKSQACITVLPKNGGHQHTKSKVAFRSKVYEEAKCESSELQLDGFSECCLSKNPYSCTINGQHLRNQSPESCKGQNQKSILEIVYCRLEEKQFHFMEAYYVGHVEDDPSPSVRLAAAADQSSIRFDWSKCNEPRSWYAIDLAQANGVHLEVGVSSCPELEVLSPPPGHVVSVRVRRVTVLDAGAEYRVSISPSIERESLPKCDQIKPKSHFEECYEKLSSEVLGYGAFGSVYLVKDSKGQCFAAKVIKTRTQKKRDTARREYEVMRMLDHPKLVALFDAYCAVDTFVLVMEYLWGGELLERVAEEEHFKEIDAVTYVRQICEALQYLHNLNIVHLDLKPENIVCISPNSNQIKLIDFGIAKVLQDGQVVKAIYGTRDYIAPEVLNYEPLTTACDMWSFGVVTYVLLSGVIPFPGLTWAERCANITKANYNFDEMAFDEISSRAKDFIKALLQKKPCSRLTAAEALEHCWLVEGPAVPAVPIKLTTINLKTYVATIRTRWQRAANVMIAANRLRCFQLRAPLS